MPAPLRKQYRRYLKFGADIIIGHHPHVAQNYERVGDKIIFYSLGNFVFDTDYQRLQNYTEYGLFVKISFYEDHFTWDHRAMKIDRETQRIVPGETPDIFTHVSPMQYFLLTPLAMRILYRNEQVKLPYLHPEMKEYTKWQYIKRYMKKRKEGILHRGIISANIAYVFGLWRLGNRKLKNYIKNGHK